MPHYNELARIMWINGSGGSLSTKVENGKNLIAAHITGIESVGIITYPETKHVTIQSEGQNEIALKLYTTTVNEGFINLTSSQWIEKDATALFRKPNSVILTRSGAERMFGKKSPIGKTITLNNENDSSDKASIYTIAGIVEDLPRSNSYSPFQTFDLYICLDENTPDDQRTQIIIMRTPGISWDEINKRIKTTTALSFIPSGRGGATFYPEARKIAVSRTSPEYFIEFGLPVTIGFLILFSGLINFFSICIGTFYNRTKELSLRKGLGAGKYGIFLLLFIESTIIVVCAAITAMILTELFISYFTINLSASVKFEIPLPILLLQELQYFPGLIILNAIIAYFTSLRLRRMEITTGVRGGNKSGNKHRIRNFSLTFQFFISLIFLGGAAIVHSQYLTFKNEILSTLSKEEKQRIFEVNLEHDQLKPYKDIILTNLQTGRGTEDILLSQSDLMGLTSLSYIQTGDEKLSIFNMEFSDNFASFLNLPLSGFVSSEKGNFMVVNKKLQDQLQNEKELDIIVVDSIGYKVTGIVDKFVNRIGDASPYISFKPLTQYNYLYVKSYPGYEKETQSLITKTIREWLPAKIPYEINSCEQKIENTQYEVTMIRNIILVLTIISLSITLLGVYSSISTDTQRRQREVAIRKVNGAIFKDIIWLFGKLYCRLLIIASCIAIPLLWLFAQTITQNFTVQFNYNNPLLWISVIGLTGVFVALTISYRLYRIARINPVNVIKSE
jgi:ABC-type antimicrobial peptide transport system permease subunit